jgi:FixJ family two-component response regulator
MLSRIECHESPTQAKEEMWVPRRYLIAVIDDDASFRPALVELLCSLGYDVEDFSCAEDLITSSGALAYDCIVTDIHLTGMSGLDLKNQLNSRAVTVPVIMITGRSDPGLEIKVAESGAVCFLRKPFTARALEECLESALADR